MCLLPSGGVRGVLHFGRVPKSTLPAYKAPLPCQRTKSIMQCAHQWRAKKTAFLASEQNPSRGEAKEVHSLHTKCTFLASEQKSSCSAPINVVRKKPCFSCQRTKSIARNDSDWTAVERTLPLCKAPLPCQRTKPIMQRGHQWPFPKNTASSDQNPSSGIDSDWTAVETYTPSMQSAPSSHGQTSLTS